jgi:predicted HTH domain antitoxin
MVVVDLAGALPGDGVYRSHAACPQRLPYTGLVKISLDLPDDLVQQLAENGQDLSRAALEALAIDAYRMNRITGHQIRNLLNISSRYELDGFLKHHGVPLEYTIEDFEREADTSARLWQKQDEHRTERDSERRPE